MARANQFFTADICDEHADIVSVLQPGFSNYGGASKCEGEILTIKLEKNNADLVKLLRDRDGTGKVVVVDVDRAYYAVVGENLMKFAQRNNYGGIIVNGYVRDIHQTKDIPVALYALGTCPQKYIPVTRGECGVSLSFGGVEFRNGGYVYADLDGVVVTSEKIEIAVGAVAGAGGGSSAGDAITSTNNDAPPTTMRGCKGKDGSAKVFRDALLYKEPFDAEWAPHYDRSDLGELVLAASCHTGDTFVRALQELTEQSSCVLNLDPAATWMVCSVDESVSIIRTIMTNRSSYRAAPFLLESNQVKSVLDWFVGARESEVHGSALAGDGDGNGDEDTDWEHWEPPAENPFYEGRLFALSSTPRNHWFQNVMDVCVACLDRDGKTVRWAAATDSD